MLACLMTAQLPILQQPPGFTVGGSSIDPGVQLETHIDWCAKHYQNVDVHTRYIALSRVRTCHGLWQTTPLTNEDYNYFQPKNKSMTKTNGYFSLRQRRAPPLTNWSKTTRYKRTSKKQSNMYTNLVLSTQVEPDASVNDEIVSNLECTYFTSVYTT